MTLERFPFAKWPSLAGFGTWRRDERFAFAHLFAGSRRNVLIAIARDAWLTHASPRWLLGRDRIWLGMHTRRQRGVNGSNVSSRDGALALLLRRSGHLEAEYARESHT